MSILITEAVAATGGDAVPSFPIIEYAVALAIAVIGGIAALRGALQKKDPETIVKQQPAAVQVYMDGPLVEMLKETKLLREGVERIPGTAAAFATLRVEFEREMKETRKAMYEWRDKLDERIREIEQDVARLEGERRRSS